MADVASRLTHLSDRQFLSQCHTHFPQSKPWRLLPLTSGCKHQITAVIVSVPAFCPRKGNLSRIYRSSNTSAQSVKYLHPWGPTTPDTTAWGRLTLGWDASWRAIRRRILLQQECGPSLSALYKPWTPPPSKPPQETLPSAISPESPSSSSSDQAYTSSAVLTLPIIPSGSRISDPSLDSIPAMS